MSSKLLIIFHSANLAADRLKTKSLFNRLYLHFHTLFADSRPRSKSHHQGIAMMRRCGPTMCPPIFDFVKQRKQGPPRRAAAGARDGTCGRSTSDLVGTNRRSLNDGPMAGGRAGATG